MFGGCSALPSVIIQIGLEMGIENFSTYIEGGPGLASTIYGIVYDDTLQSLIGVCNNARLGYWDVCSVNAVTGYMMALGVLSLQEAQLFGAFDPLNHYYYVTQIFVDNQTSTIYQVDVIQQQLVQTFNVPYPGLYYTFV